MSRGKAVMAPTSDAFDRSSEHPYEALLLQLATLAQRRLDRADGADRLYATGVRDAYVNCVALTLAGLDARRGEAVTQRVTEALRAGTRGQDRLLDTALHAAGQPDPRPSGLTWVSPRAFEVQHGRRGIDEDYGLGWGRSRSTRISWRRLPDCDQGLLYAFDTVWDEYAVLADPVHRDVVREAYPTP